MFSNNSVKLVTLKNRFLMTAKALHSIRMCLTVQVVWHVKHCGCGSCFSMKAWVSRVWPMCSWDITTCSLLNALKAGLYSPKVGWIWKSLLLMFMSHCCCHFLWKNLLIIGFKLVIWLLSLLFRFLSLRCGLESNSKLFFYDIESSLLSNLTINGFSSFFFSSDVNTESKSENDKFVMFVPRNDIESKVNSTYFCSEDGAFHWKSLFVNYFI